MQTPKHRITSLITSIKTTQIKNILIVGAGGIGCQLIKNLYKTPHNLTLIDYDTISQSNLNRQFCFRKQDIGKYKVQVLKQYFMAINPQLNIRVQNGNIYQYDELYFSQFDVVISALDNNQARCYLNQMAIDHHIVMIDAGTAGYNGQVQCFNRFVTQCRMCRPQPSEDISFAVCSLRGKPQRNIHCIQFSLILYEVVRELHKWLYGRSNNMEQNRNQWQSLYKIFKKSIKEYSLLQLEEICIEIHNIIFYENITQINQPKVKPIQHKPNSTNLTQIFEKTLNNKQQTNPTKILQIFSSPESEQLLLQKQNPTQFYSYLFVQCLKKILSKQDMVEDYDKDSLECSLFVYSVANLRIVNFRETSYSKLRGMSYYECKDMSGKIIPAIASTNSIAAALQVLILLQLTNNTTNPHSYLSIKSYHPENKIQKYQPYKPKTGCPHCSPLYNYIELQVNLSITTWGQIQQYFIQNLDESLKERDMRCGQFVVIRNSGRKWYTNKSKFIDSNGKLVKMSKIGVRVVVVKYIPDQSQSSWKIVLIDIKDAKEKIRAKKEIDKKIVQENIQNQIQKVMQNKKLFQHSQDHKLDDVEIYEEQI